MRASTKRRQTERPQKRGDLLVSEKKAEGPKRPFLPRANEALFSPNFNSLLFNLGFGSFFLLNPKLRLSTLLRPPKGPTTP